MWKEVQKVADLDHVCRGMKTGSFQDCWQFETILNGEDGIKDGGK